jgi:hypothetical protein
VSRNQAIDELMSPMSACTPISRKSTLNFDDLLYPLAPNLALTH